MTNTEAKRPTPDTSPEAVERLAESYVIPGMPEDCRPVIVATTLRALSAELEAEKATVKMLHDLDEISVETVQQLTAELTELKAELAEAVEVIVIAQALIDPCYPSQHGDWQREARAFLARHKGNTVTTGSETTNQKETDT